MFLCCSKSLPDGSKFAPEVDLGHFCPRWQTGPETSCLFVAGRQGCRLWEPRSMDKCLIPYLCFEIFAWQFAKRNPSNRNLELILCGKVRSPQNGHFNFQTVVVLLYPTCPMPAIFAASPHTIAAWTHPMPLCAPSTWVAHRCKAKFLLILGQTISHLWELSIDTRPITCISINQV
jgi:hypothetical protein